MKFGRSPIPDCNSSQYFYYHQSSANDFSEDTLSCGDSVHLADAEYKKHHYAVYLANGYYISLLGTGGPLLISTLDQLKHFYHATQIARISLFPYPDSNMKTNISGRTPNEYFRLDPISQFPTATTANTRPYFFSKVELPAIADKDAKIASYDFGVR